MIVIDADKLIEAFGRIKTMFHGAYMESQKVALRQLVDFINADTGWKYTTEIAYFLTTIAHETAKPGGKELYRTYLPIREIGSRDYFTRRYETNKKMAKILGNTKIGDGARFPGRGYVQNTGRSNAETTGEILSGMFVHKSLLNGLCDPAAKEAFKKAAGRSDGLIITPETFTTNPDLLLIPRISYMDASERVRDRRISYTGRIFSDYIHSEDKYDFVNARKTINGNDKKHDIAALAEAILKAVRYAQVKSIPEGEAQPSQEGNTAPPTTAESNEDFVFDPFALKDQVSLVRPLAARTLIGAGSAWSAITAFVVGLTLAQKIALIIFLVVVIGLIVYGFLKLKEHGVFPYLWSRVKQWIGKKH